MMDTYALVVEETIVEMLQESGATELDGDDIMVNLRELGGYIRRDQITGEKAEFITLFMGGEISKVMYVWEEQGEVKNAEMTKDELERVMGNGIKTS